MEAAVIDAGSSLLKAGFAIPDQTPAMVITSLDSHSHFSKTTMRVPNF
jgi:actin-related protein